MNSFRFTSIDSKIICNYFDNWLMVNVSFNQTCQQFPDSSFSNVNFFLIQEETEYLKFQSVSLGITSNLMTSPWALENCNKHFFHYFQTFYRQSNQSINWEIIS